VSVAIQLVGSSEVSEDSITITAVLRLGSETLPDIGTVLTSKETGDRWSVDGYAFCQAKTLGDMMLLLVALDAKRALRSGEFILIPEQRPDR